VITVTLQQGRCALTHAAGRCGAIETADAPAPPVHSPSSSAAWSRQRFSSLAASLHRLHFAKSYLIHLAAVLNERLRLRLCPAAPHGSRVLSIIQRAQPAISLSMQFNAADVAAASHLPRLLHPSTCLADSLSAPASPRLLQRSDNLTFECSSMLCAP
jgi:hypothetical protein